MHGRNSRNIVNPVAGNMPTLPPTLNGGVVAMPQLSGKRADSTTSGDEVAMLFHVRSVRSERTSVNNVDCVRAFRDSQGMNRRTTGAVLLDLKRRAGDPSLDKIAAAAGYAGRSSVQAFFNQSYDRPLDTDVASKLSDALVGHGDPPIARAEVFALTGITDGVGAVNLHIGNTPEHAPMMKSEQGSVPLRHIDMSLAMGEGRTIEDYYEEGAFEFDASLLRQLSRSPPHRLVVGHGIGDSMVPTIHDDAMVIFDTTQTVLNTDDKIWAISLFGAGSIKRLQVIGRDRVLVVSDNPIVPNKEVSTEDLRILGRVIWSARRH